MSDPHGQHVQRYEFNNLGEWIAWMNRVVGLENWYIAGGFAAHLRIEAYLDKDTTYYSSVRESIFPSDVEIGIKSTAVEESSAVGQVVKRKPQEPESGKRHSVLIGGRPLDVSMFPAPEVQFLYVSAECTPLHGANVVGPQAIIDFYLRAANAEKAAKRATRMAMLKLIMAGKRIDAKSMEPAPDVGAAAPSMMSQISAGGFKFKNVGVKSPEKPPIARDEFVKSRDQDKREQTEKQ